MSHLYLFLFIYKYLNKEKYIVLNYDLIFIYIPRSEIQHIYNYYSQSPK